MAGGKSIGSPPRRPRAVFHHLVQMVLLLFVLAWVFILGVLVGRGQLWQTIPGKMVVLWLEDRIGRAGPAEVETRGPAKNQEPVKPAILRPPAPAAPRPPAPGTQASPGNLPSAYFSQNPVILEELELATEQQADPRLPAAGAWSDRPAGRFAVQAAVPDTAARAEKEVAKLRALGYNAYYYQAAAGRFPVRVGPFASAAEAGSVRAALSARGYHRPFISQLQE